MKGFATLPDGTTKWLIYIKDWDFRWQNMYRYVTPFTLLKDVQPSSRPSHVRGTVEKFQETWHDDGKTDLLECMKAYREVGFDGVLRPDHVPTVEGDNNDRPGYSAFGRLYAIGYIRGLRQAVYAG